MPVDKHTQETPTDEGSLRALHREFWTQFLPKAASATPRFADRRTTDDHFISASAGARGVFYVYIVRVQTSGVGLDIGSHPGPAAFNKSVFDFLQQRRSQIEKNYGGQLSWDRLDLKLASRIHDAELTGGCRSPRGQWPRIQTGMIAAMVRLESSLAPHLSAAIAHALPKA